MTTSYFFRHGQAGQRDDYDRLSDTGREQARLLGQHLRREALRFDLAIVGGLRRQRETAEIVLEQLRSGGLEPARIDSDARWNEFDLDEVYAGIAPQIAAEDPEFRAAYEEVERLIRAGDGHIHRQWTPSDTRVVKSWIEGRYQFHGESWTQFVTACSVPASRSPNCRPALASPYSPPPHLSPSSSPMRSTATIRSMSCASPARL